MTDNEVLSGLWASAKNPAEKAHVQAQRITDRRHFRMLYESNPIDRKVNLQSVELVYEAARKEFGDDSVRHDPYKSVAEAEEFPVYQRDGSIASSVALSETLQNGPSFAVDYVFVDPDLKEKAKMWLDKEKQKILAAQGATQ